MFNTVNEALDHAKRHGLSTSEILEGYRRERAPILPAPCNDLNIDRLENSDGQPVGCCAHIDVCCLECREDVSEETLRVGGTFYTESIECPNCMEAICEYAH